MYTFQMTKRISKTLESTSFSGALIVPVAAKPGGPDTSPAQGALGIDNLIQVRIVFSLHAKF